MLRFRTPSIASGTLPGIQEGGELSACLVLGRAIRPGHRPEPEPAGPDAGHILPNTVDALSSFKGCICITARRIVAVYLDIYLPPEGFINKFYLLCTNK